MKISPQAAIVQAFKIIDEKILGHISPYLPEMNGRPNPTYWRQLSFYQLMQELEDKGYLPKNSRPNYEQLRRARNYAAHADTENANGVDWKAVFQIAEGMIKGLQNAEQNNYQFVPLDEKDMPG